MENDEFYLVKTKLGSCDVSNEEIDRACQVWCCPECFYMRKGVTAVNGIQLESRSDELDKPLELGVKTGLVLRRFANRAEALQWEKETVGTFRDLGHLLGGNKLPKGIPFREH